MVEIDKSYTKSVNVTLDIKWIGPATTEPATPTDYVRATEWDINLGDIGILYGFVKT